jgi:uncharacterized BrkB/YihY/UPF0761 family membrane protein
VFFQDLSLMTELRTAFNAAHHVQHQHSVPWWMKNMHSILIGVALVTFTAIFLVVLTTDGSSKERDRRLRRSRGDTANAQGEIESRKVA